MSQVLYVHENESIAYLIDRMESQKSQKVFISFDANLGLLQDMVNVKLLKREASALGKSLVVVSKNSEVLAYAKGVGFETAESAEETADVYAVERSSHMPFLAKDKTEAVIRDIKQPSFLARKTEVSEGVDMPDEVKEIRVDVASEDVANKYSQISIHNEHEEDEALSFFEKNGKTAEKKFEPSLFNKRPNEQKASIRSKLSISKIFSDKKILAVFVFLILILAGAAFYVFRSKAELNITIKKEKIDFTIPVLADSTISKTDVENSKIPGQIIKLSRDISGEFEATGASSGATKAKGKIAVYNEYSAEPQALIANTRFQSSDGKIYRIEKKVTVPGAKMSGGKAVSAGMIEAEVIADQAGSDYNISASEFKIPGFEGTDKYNGFYAKSTEPMAGGSLGETRAVTQVDIDNAKSDLENKLRASAKEYVASNVPGGLTVLDAAINEKVENFDTPKIGAAVNKFTASLKVSYSIFAFDHKNLSVIAENQLTSRVIEGRKTFPDTLILEYEGGTLDLDKSTFSFIAKASEIVGGDVNQDDLKNMLAGKDEVEIKKILSANNAIENADITLWPRWSSKAPKNADKIKINIQE